MWGVIPLEQRGRVVSFCRFVQTYSITAPLEAGPIPVAWSKESAFELYQRIDRVAIVHGHGRQLEVAEFNSAARLLKHLWHIGRTRGRVRGMISPCGALSAGNVAAFNCYLEHHFARQSIDALRSGKLHRFTWYEMQAAVPLVWS